MMKHILRFAGLALLALCLTSAAQAATATPTPPPVMIQEAPATPPDLIQDVLDIAYNEWETLAGQALDRCNKYTEWRGKGVSFGWCAGYVTWCMLEAGVPQEEQEYFLDRSRDTEDGFFPVEGVMHVKEAGVGKLLTSYQRMNRTTMIPQPGFILVYGCSYNKTIHVGLVYAVEQLGEGRYRITTLEGNMSNRVKMYVHDYDMNVEVNTNSRKSTNLTEIPEEARTEPETSYLDYSVPEAKPSSGASNKYPYYVNCFLMPWVPGDETLEYAEELLPEDAAEDAADAEDAEELPLPEDAAEDAADAVDAEELPLPEDAAEDTADAVDAEELPLPEETAEDAADAEDAEELPLPEETPVADPDDLSEETAPASDEPAFPCHGKGGACPYVTRHADDLFCRHCDRNDNGMEDALE